MTDAVKLEPCPFCGAHLTLYKEAAEIPPVWDHPHGDCALAALTFRDPAAWNRRPLPPSAVQDAPAVRPSAGDTTDSKALRALSESKEEKG